MKPFTLLLIFLGLIVGLYLLRHLALEPEVEPPVEVQVRDEAQPAPQPPAIEYRIDSAGEGETIREQAEGLPVPIVPGTRVSEAKILPPEADPAMIVSPGGATRRNPHVPPVRLAVPAQMPGTVRAVSGRLSATVERARADARLQLEREVTEWLTPEVPTPWKPPAHLISRMIRKAEVHPIVKDYGTVYEASLEADFSPYCRSAIVAAYDREVVTRRLLVLGASLGFVLVCLGALAGYIHADEATKGYYTQWLRAIAAAGVGASGVVIYQILT